MSFMERLKLSAQIGLWAGDNGWKPTRRKCAEGSRIYAKDGVDACTHQLMLMMQGLPHQKHL